MKLNTKRTVLVGMAFLSICTFWQMYEAVIPLILKHTFHVSDTASGAVMALDNVLALFMLPLFGSLSDKTSTRFGKRTPFIVAGTAASCLFMLLIPLADRLGIFWMFITALLLVLVSMSIYRSPAVALMPDLTPKPLRSKGNAIINLMGAIGGMITLVLIQVLVPGHTSQPDYFPLFAAVAFIMLLSVVLLVFTIPEKRLAEETAALSEPEEEQEEDIKENRKASLPTDVKKSLVFLLLSVAFWFMGYNAVTSAFSKYAQIQWGMTGGSFASSLLVATGAAILSYIPVGMAATRIGRKKTILFGVAALALCFFSGALFPTYHPAVNIVFALVGISWAAINVNSYPMVVEMSRGSNVGKFTGYYYTFSMAAQIITPIFSGALLEHVGYWTLFPYAALFAALAFVTMLLVRHGDSKPLPAKSKLEAFDTPD
ncbi:MAG TPA: MFS transporter [Candidatus Gallacutalibacter pullistercoris]|nr:MFS transporter [Candidatus Gallacutalibacter pullistercoris]